MKHLRVTAFERGMEMSFCCAVTLNKFDLFDWIYNLKTAGKEQKHSSGGVLQQSCF